MKEHAINKEAAFMKELIVFGEDYNRHPSSSQHIVNTLQHQFASIQWINSIGLRKPSPSPRDLARIREKLRNALTVTPCRDDLPPPFPVIHPLVWPLAEHPLLRWFNQLSVRRQLARKRHLRVVWAALPSAVDYLDALQADVVIYYCGDDFSGLAGVDHTRVKQMEERMAKRADLILCASPALVGKMSQLSPQNTHLLRHGVDFHRFAAPQPDPYPPAPSPTQGRYKVGFYGSLNQWLDQTLLCELAAARPEVDFHLIGRRDCESPLLDACDNIKFHPPVPHQHLAQYVQHWDAALLPFVDNAQIRACDPLKLREYLAAGCPVISSNFPAARQYPCLVSVATSQQDWLDAIDAFCHLSQQHRLQYRKTARQHMVNESWDMRGDTVLTLINSILEEKQTCLPEFSII
ncbi:glycosyltransferase [Photobacterium sp. TY1-4]|uniref:glycosyltransferase n=1 Tax=Photobacterium sp. TY1-4 TaxID=2899122 RepID=UPI0021C1300C|nr:glycosyltransferase [Photobacterium sp. TY1-4]UXI00237.1 glycosyltransferase [Photobacterium sp. TY1-4]